MFLLLTYLNIEKTNSKQEEVVIIDLTFNISSNNSLNMFLSGTIVLNNEVLI